MDPWIGDNEAFVKDVCRKLHANDSSYVELEVDYAEAFSDEEWRVLANAMKRNTTIEKLYISSDNGDAELSVSAALSLAAAILVHPKLERLKFRGISFAEFSPIALSILQNEKLTYLLLRFCTVTPRLTENIRFLIMENALEALWLDENVDQVEMDIGEALGRNQSLKELVITNSNGIDVTIMSGSMLEGIAHMLRENQGFQKLQLELSEIENCSELMTQLARSARGHASLKNLSLLYSRELEGDAAEAFAELMTNAPALRELDLVGCNMGDEQAIRLASGLSSEACFLKAFNLSENQIGGNGASAIAAALRENTAIEKLYLSQNEIGAIGSTAMASMLGVNTSLKVLDIESNQIGDGAVQIFQALRINRSLERLEMDCSGKNHLEAVTSCLPCMSSLKRLRLNDAECFTSEIGSAFLRAVEQNTTLENFDIYPSEVNPYYIHKIRPRVQHIMALNRGGRRVLSSDVPRSLWPRVLAKSSDNPDVIYFFLREKPDVFFKRTALGKRKRDHNSCIIS